MHNIDENEVLRDALSGLNEDVPPMPENLHAAWMQKVEDDMAETKSGKTRTMKNLTRWLSVAAAVVFVFGGTLLTRDDLNSALLRRTLEDSYEAIVEENDSLMLRAAQATEYAEDIALYTTETAENGVMLTSAKRSKDTGAVITGAGAEETVATDKKIIRTASMSIATQTFEDSLNNLRASCEEQGGWIESSSESVNSYSGLRTAYLTLRVPQDMLDAYLAGTEGLGRITSRSESATDVTASYQDTATRLSTQLALMERLQALITESGDLSDLLALESQIADTQYMIDSLQSSLNATDRQVAYSTVSITLQEERTVELTDNSVSFGDRIVSAVQVGFEGLIGFLGDAVVFLVAALPYIAIVAVAAIVIKVIRKRRK